MNYERLYSYRFRDIDQDGRARRLERDRPHVHGLMGSPQKVLDPAAGRGEFIGAVPAKETWAVDAVSYEEAAHKPDTTVITSSIMDAELPAGPLRRRLRLQLPRAPLRPGGDRGLPRKDARGDGAGRPDRDHGPELPLLRRRVLGLRRSLRRPHPRRDRRAPLRGRLRARADHPPLPAVLLPGHPAALAAADPPLPEDAARPGGCSASSSW